jgi:glycosyltransferase involved in cell wall biosynthesis
MEAANPNYQTVTVQSVQIARGESVQVSLIVCTRNRASRLPYFLERLCSLESPRNRWELILVDHASTDSTGDVIARFASGAPFPVRHLRATAPALTGAKNAAIAHSRGEILAFTDDDCYPRPDHLRALVEVFSEHPVGIVGGRVLLHDPSDARVSIRDVETPSGIEPASFVRPGVIHGANMAMTRELVCAMGGFDPLFGPGAPCVAAEDVEYIARAVWAGWRARYDPTPVVAHHHGRKPGKDTDRYVRGYDYGRGAYYAKFLLNSRARKTYLQHWRWLVRERSGQQGARRKLLGELAGAQRYLLQRALHPEPIPQFRN